MTTNATALGAIDAPPSRFDALDFGRALAILGMLGSHLVGIENGVNAFERGVSGTLAAIEPTVGALFCVLAGISWSIQADRVGTSPRFVRYIAGRALALGVFGVAFHVLFWKTEILVPFALMMAFSLVVLGKAPHLTALALMVFIGVTPFVEHVVASFAATDWLENGLHVADRTVGWATLRYLLVDGNYPLISWMAFPLMGMLFWRTARSRQRIQAWLVGSLGVTVATYAVAVSLAPTPGAEGLRQFIAGGWTPTSAIFLLVAGGGALTVVSMLLVRWGTASMPGIAQPLVLLGRASLSHYVLHIVVAYSLLRLQFPGEDWPASVGLLTLALYLGVSIPVTKLWFRHHAHGPIEWLLARSSRRPAATSHDRLVMTTGPMAPDSGSPIRR